MGYVLNTSVGSLPEVLALVGSEDDEETCGWLRGRADEADRQAPGPSGHRSVREGLEDLLAGRELDHASGDAYARAFVLMTEAFFYRGPDSGPFPRPSVYLQELDRALADAGVAPRLLPTGFVFGGPPPGVDLPVHEWPQLGWLPAEEAVPLVDAYSAALDRLAEDFRTVTSELRQAARLAVDLAESRLKRGEPPISGVLTRLG